ncbi:MAG: glycosyltransferase family 4 protein [Candidatus Acidiferrum sp.]
MKLLFLTTEESSFWSHRLALARTLRSQGVDVVIMTRAGEHRSRLEEEGFRVIPWSIARKSLNPVKELRSFFQVCKSYREERPDIVHHIALKPIVYGSLAARVCGCIPSVNTVTGLGPVFVRANLTSKVLRNVLVRFLRACFRAKNSRVILQNEDDRDLFLKAKIASAEKTTVIPGFGISTEQFVPSPEPDGDFVVMLPGRMLWEKGVREFVEAARELHKRCASLRMVLVGAPDPNNPGSIPERQLREWAESGNVEWWGQQTDMSRVLHHSHLVCLPSYREGLPKVLLEAGACGRAVVTTDAPGCSYVVQHGKNGLLVPIQDSRALVDAIHSLLLDRIRRLQMGMAGRERAVREFSEGKIARQTLEVYADLLNGVACFHLDSSREKVKAMTSM